MAARRTIVHPQSGNSHGLRKHPRRNPRPRRPRDAESPQGAERAQRRIDERARRRARQIRRGRRNRRDGPHRQRQGLRGGRRHRRDEGLGVHGRLQGRVHHAQLGADEVDPQARDRRGRGLRARRRLRARVDVRHHHRGRHGEIRPARDQARHHPRSGRHAAPAARSRQGQGDGPRAHRTHDGRGRGRARRPRFARGRGGQAARGGSCGGGANRGVLAAVGDDGEGSGQPRVRIAARGRDALRAARVSRPVRDRRPEGRHGGVRRETQAEVQTQVKSWRVIAWMCAAHVTSMAGFSTYATLLPRLQEEWGLNNSQAGFISGAFFAGYMAAVPLLTSLTDRVDARRVYLVSSVVAAVALAGMALFAEGLFSASLLQLCAGAGIAGTYMPGLRALTDNVSGTGAQSRAVSFYTAVFGLGTSLSILLSGWIADTMGFRWAFGLGAIGPLAAGLMVALGLPPRKPAPLHGTRMLDFRPVLKSREVRPYIFGYAVHCWELFGSRSWLVAFIVFAQDLRIAEGSAAAAWSAVAIAAVANLIAPAASIGGNELAMRHGRERLIWMTMLASGVLTCALGFAAALPSHALVGLIMLHMCLVMSDSSALTAGLVTRIDERIRGAAMAVHSMLGFGAGFFAPLVFGAVLDLAGGNSSPLAWGLAFVSLGVGAIAMAWAIRRRAAFGA